ncbi:flagellar hook-associated protein FlgK [Pseudoalteromonas tunicata]|uniref:Flagellar hook-associated protein 1 n=1 Tax=Pseudoalteromonas tunicata D2 TaxID=87626 RepID=A4C6G3_9GAMM|nr:flagellar hook-associated protein FlgK [Pseudoalteromonas tunicata]ATC95541.1 flagellar hook-associated protein 1 FlgK [Pseudoalteromonas tunicata]AXT31114.1 flagellar hook-associated protein FlgK [Pseudoalteromonas tunicata]EAR29567.1 flagellar hook-associated protein [Pseudoalteromonas tunicata D2]
MSFGILGTGVSGLAAAQKGLDTTGHNIANVNTTGYNRQTVEQISTVGIPFGGVFLGNGTQVSSISRAFNEFSYTEVIYNKSQFNYNNTQTTNASRLDNFLANTDTGITKSIEESFNAINGITEDPTIISARNVFLSSAESTAKRFNNMFSEVEQQHLGNINQEIKTTVAAINEITARIGQLNGEIAVANSVAENGFPANDLLDKRDLLVSQLSEKVQVNIIDLPDGTINLTVGTGLTLVAGTFAVPLSVERNEFDSNKLEVGIAPTPGAPNKAIVTNQLDGGSLGGLFKIREELLLPAIRDMGKIAIAYADAFNRQQSLGRDLNGDEGTNLFKDINDPQVALTRTLNSKQNPTASDFSVNITNASLLTGEEYLMEVDQTGNLVVSDKDKNVLATYTPADIAAMSPPTNDRLEIPDTGLNINIAKNNLAVGDRFLIRATYSGSREIERTLEDPNLVAAAGNALDVSAPTNPNNVELSLYEITDTSNANFPNQANFPPPLDPQIRVVVDATGTQYSIQDSAGNPLAAPAGGPFNIPSDQVIDLPGMRLELKGQLAGNEVFNITNQGGTAPFDEKKFGPGDNSNALIMLEYQNKKTLDGGTNTFSESYAELVTFVGVKTQSGKINADSFAVLLAGAEQRMAAISGVNLDEEAANLIRYQQAYSAAARIISIANETFDSLLQAVR